MCVANPKNKHKLPPVLLSLKVSDWRLYSSFCSAAQPKVRGASEQANRIL
jgi:hypothetical protein